MSITGCAVSFCFEHMCVQIIQYARTWLQHHCNPTIRSHALSPSISKVRWREGAARVSHPHLRGSWIGHAVGILPIQRTRDPRRSDSFGWAVYKILFANTGIGLAGHICSRSSCDLWLEGGIEMKYFASLFHRLRSKARWGFRSKIICFKIVIYL